MNTPIIVLVNFIRSNPINSSCIEIRNPRDNKCIVTYVTDKKKVLTPVFDLFVIEYT